MMSSKTGDLLLELEAETSVIRDQWVSPVNTQTAKPKAGLFLPGT